MARFAIETEEGLLEFFVVDEGGYVRLESADRPGTLGRQICAGGGFTGSTLRASAATLPEVARQWYEERMANA